MVEVVVVVVAVVGVVVVVYFFADHVMGHFPMPPKKLFLSSIFVFCSKQVVVAAVVARTQNTRKSRNRQEQGVNN